MTMATGKNPRASERMVKSPLPFEALEDSTLLLTLAWTGHREL